MSNSRRTWIIDFAVIVLIAAALIWPIFKTKYYENWLTIDSTFIADGRYLAENWPHPGWNYLWYGGTRWDYIYPPALRYGTAGLAKLFNLIPARAYHLYTAIFYALGIGFVYLFVRIGSKVRFAGWMAAFCAATLSPGYLFLKEMRWDTKPFMPQRLNVLVRYGEGPHMTAFALFALGLALSWRGLRAGQTRWLAAASLVLAYVVSNNFYGATALAFTFPILTIAIYCETKDLFVWVRAACIAGLSFALCAFWLTPSFLTITARNLALVAQPGHPWSLWTMIGLIAIYGVVSWALARRGAEGWTLFVLGAAMVFSVNVLGNYYGDFRITGEPSRLVPELDLFVILLLTWLGYLAWHRWPTMRVRAALALFFFLSCVPAYRYFRNPWYHFTRTSEYKHRKEYQIADWVANNRPHTRSYVTGTLRFWWNAWHNNEQIGGGSEQGVHNFQITPFFWRTVISPEPSLDIAWMQAFGVDNVAVNDKTSALPIVDFEHPHKYQNVLKVLWEDGKGNWLYEIPRKHPGLARVVDAARHANLKAPLHGDDAESVNAYVDVLEKSTEAKAETRWANADTLEVNAATVPGQAIIVQVAHDGYWRAAEGSQTYPVTGDPFGQMRIDVPPGDHRIVMHFDTPKENLSGRWISATALMIALLLLLKPRNQLRQ
ncbi:MAG: hypothetical protein HYX27_10875 [Acidobacteria bacterium]|nr:hypothetical protein [Acidobacteriota bacterium]